MTARGRSLLLLILVAGFGWGTTALVRAGDDYVEAILPKGPVPEEQLLDVSIDLFSPSVDDSDREALTNKGLHASVRKSEARYFPIHLRNTLQSTGQWGAVRVVPGGAPWAEISVVGKIIKSNGKDLELEVRAVDATGEQWLDEEYHETATALSYASDKLGSLDPFQSVFNEIANDLVKARSKRKPHDLQRLRQVAALRFDTEFAPGSFGPYLSSDKKGRYKAVRLPAAGDPMLGRLALVRTRDDLFVDTLNEYYSDFYARMDKPYDQWRASSYVEQAAYDSLHKSSVIKKVVGGILVLGGILMPDDRNTGVKDVAVLGGIAAIQSGMKDSGELGIHKAALEELADSFDGEVRELLVDVDGKIVHLRGSAEAQFQQWRQLLEKIAATETGLPRDINVTRVAGEVVVTPPPAAAPPSVTPPEPPAADGPPPDEPPKPDAPEAAPPGPRSDVTPLVIERAGPPRRP
jgi:hypothetical protein